MPLQIKELHIKVSVDGNEGGTEGLASESGGMNSNSLVGAGQKHTDIIAECVDQVLEILKEKLES